jgi:hypothetical protein
LFLIVASNNLKSTDNNNIDTSAGTSRERSTIQRSAKSKAKEAITSILLPSQLDQQKITKIDQLNNSKQKQNFASFLDTSDNNNNNNNKSINSQKGRSRSSKRRRSQSSTLAIETTTTTTTTVVNNKKNFKNNSDKSAASVGLSHNLRSSRKTDDIEENLPTTSRKITRNSVSNKTAAKTVPNKKAKLNSDINNNLNSESFFLISR